MVFLPSAAQSFKKIAPGEPEIFGTGMCDRTAGFYHVLSVFVVPSVSVESTDICQRWSSTSIRMCKAE